MHLPFWFVIVSILWHFGAYFGPYLLMALFPLALLPFSFALLLYFIYEFREKREASRLLWAVPLCLIVFVLFTGIPKVNLGWFFDFLTSKTFGDGYWWCIQKWWAGFNWVNPFADRPVPFAMYKFQLLPAQVCFYLGAFVMTPIFFNVFYTSSKEKREILLKETEEREQKQERDRLQVIADKKWEEEEQRERQQQERLDNEAREQEKKKKQEATAPNPWDSGFL